MGMVRRRPPSVHSAAADSWPDWTDADTWELGPIPTDDDRRWAADNLNGVEWHDQDEPVPDEVYDRWAEEAEAQDLLNRGILPV